MPSMRKIRDYQFHKRKNRKEDLKAYNFIPVAAMFRAAQAATGNVSTCIDTMFEGDMADSLTGQRLAAIVAEDIEETEKPSSDEPAFDDVKPALDKWLYQFRRTLKQCLARVSASWRSYGFGKSGIS